MSERETGSAEAVSERKFENADQLYSDLKDVDIISFAEKSSNWVLTHWSQEKHSKAKLKELE